MHLDVVAVLVVFCIAFTVSLRSDTSNNEFLPQPIRHGRRHHRHEEKYIAKNKERNRNSNSNNNNNFNVNTNPSNKSNRKRARHNQANNQWALPRHGHHQNNNGVNVRDGQEKSGSASAGPLLASLLHHANSNHHQYSSSNRGGGGEPLPMADVYPGGGGGGIKQTGVAECCPSETRMVELVYGISRNNTLLEIYNNASKPQRFYEVVCAPNVTNRTCKFVEASLQPYSSCVERFTYTYAIVRDHPLVNNLHHVHRPDNADWRLDYIRIPSGCFCEFRNFVNR